MKNEKQKNTVVTLSVLVFLNLLLIWGNSLLSREDSSSKSSFLTSILMHFLPKDADFGTVEHIIRKCAHFTEFALLGALTLCLTYAVCAFELRRTWSCTAIPLLGCLFAASTDEMIQIFTARGNSVADVALDFSGSLTAFVIVYAVLLIMQRRKRGVRPETPPDAAQE